jgi:hypothetical protein
MNQLTTGGAHPAPKLHPRLQPEVTYATLKLPATSSQSAAVASDGQSPGRQQ